MIVFEYKKSRKSVHGGVDEVVDDSIARKIGAILWVNDDVASLLRLLI